MPEASQRKKEARTSIFVHPKFIIYQSEFWASSSLPFEDVLRAAPDPEKEMNPEPYPESKFEFGFSDSDSFSPGFEFHDSKSSF